MGSQILTGRPYRGAAVLHMAKTVWGDWLRAADGISMLDHRQAQERAQLLLASDGLSPSGG